MVKLLHYWLSRLTLFCLLAFAAGGVAKAADLTVHCQIEGEGSANIWTLDATGFPMVGTPLVNGKDVVIKDVITLFGNLPITLDSFTGTLTDVLVDGVSNDDAMFQYNNSFGDNAQFELAPKADGSYEMTLKLVFEGEAPAQVNGVIHCEVTGDVEASATLTYVSNDFSVNIKKDFVNGQDAVFENLDLDGETEGMYVQITGITPGEELTDILVNGVRDEEAWESFEFYRKYGQYNTGVTISPSNGGYDATVTLVFGESEPAPAYNLVYNVEIEGNGTVDYKYYDLETISGVTGTFEVGPNYFNAWSYNDKTYTVDIFPKAAEGSVLSEVWVNGEKNEDAVESVYGTKGYFTNSSEAGEVNIKFVFTEESAEPAYNLVYNVEIEGNGTVDYKYYDLETISGVTGTFEIGPNYFNAWSYNDKTYTVDIFPKAAEGSVLSEVWVNGEKNEDAVESVYGTKGYFTNSSEAGEVNIKFVFTEEGGSEPAENFTINFTIEGEGTVEFGPYSNSKRDFDYKVVTDGEEFSYPKDDWYCYDEVGYGYYSAIRVPEGTGANVTGIYINGTLDEMSTNYVQAYDSYDGLYISTASNPATIKVVFAGGGTEPEADMNVNLSFEGGEGATVTYTYNKADNTGIASGTFVAGENPLTNVQNRYGNYMVTASVTANPGYVVKEVYLDDALQSTPKSIDLMTTEKGKTFNLRVVCEAEVVEPVADMIINLSFEGGEGADVRYMYSKADNASEKVTGDLVAGENLLNNIYAAWKKYTVNIMIDEIDGYTLKAVYLNDVAESVNGFMIKADELGQTYNIRVVCESDEPVVPEVYNQTYEVEIEGSGTVGYEYTDADGALQSGDFANGNNYFNVQQGESGYYVKVSPEAGEGYALSEIWIDGAEADWAVADVNDHGYFENTTEADVTKVKVVFAPAIVTQTFHVTINGEGCGATYKYTDATTQEIVTGRLENGGTYGMNPSVLPSGKFTVTINPEAAAGYEIASATANGEELDVTYWTIQGIKVNTADTEVNLVLNFEPIVVEDFVVNFEVDGTSNMLFTADFDVDAGFIYGEDVVVDGDSFTYKTDKLFEGDGGWYVSMMTNDDKKASTLDSVYINGTFDETLTTNLQMSGSANFGLPKDVNPATIKLVFEDAGKPDADMIVNLTVENYEGVEGGSATVSYAGGTLNVGENKLYDILSGGSYEVALSVIPTEGYAIRDVYIDDVKTYNTPEAVYITRAEKGSVVNVRVVCDEAYTITMKPTGIEGVSYSVRLALLDLKENRNYMSAVDEDVIVAVPKSVSNPYFTWNRDVGSYYTFRDFLVNGKSIYDVSADGGGQQYNITSDVELELVVVETEYYELTTVACEGGKYYIEYEEFDMQSGNYIWLPYEEGIDALMTGTAYRVTFEAAEGYVLLGAYVNDEQVFSATVADEEYEYTYEGVVWSPIEFKMVTKPLSVDGVYAEPVQMYVYSVDGMLIRSCMAKSVDEAVEGLAQGLYIVNGRKVVVEK